LEIGTLKIEADLPGIYLDSTIRRSPEFDNMHFRRFVTIYQDIKPPAKTIWGEALLSWKKFDSYSIQQCW